MKCAKKLTVYGRVQGVGFRYYTRQRACIHSVYGWIENTFEGTVQIHCEAEDAQLRAFICDVTKGPTFASVDNVDEQETDIEGHVDFHIR